MKSRFHLPKQIKIIKNLKNKKAIKKLVCESIIK